MLQNCYIYGMTQRLVDFLDAATKGASNRAMAEKIGIVHTTLKAQLASDKTPGLTLAQLCRAYGIPFDEAAVAAGWVTPEEAQAFGASFNLAGVSERELMKEVLRRVTAGTASSAITEPTSDELIDDVLREVEDSREHGKQSDYAAAADDDVDRTPGGDHDEDDRAGL